MDLLAVAQAVVGGLLLFVVPGFTVAKAVFPERRLRGADGVRWALELAALAFVLSVVLTVVAGYVLLVGAPGGFSAAWGDPLLEAVLAAVAVVGFVVGWLAGAYDRVPPVRHLPEAAGVDPWELSERLDQLQRERRSIERRLRREPLEGESGEPLRARRAAILTEEQTLRDRRQAEYDV